MEAQESPVAPKLLMAVIQAATRAELGKIPRVSAGEFSHAGKSYHLVVSLEEIAAHPNAEDRQETEAHRVAAGGQKAPGCTFAEGVTL